MAKAFMASSLLAVVLVAALVVPLSVIPGAFGFHGWPTSRGEAVTERQVWVKPKQVVRAVRPSRAAPVEPQRVEALRQVAADEPRRESSTRTPRPQSAQGQTTETSEPAPTPEPEQQPPAEAPLPAPEVVADGESPVLRDDAPDVPEPIAPIVQAVPSPPEPEPEVAPSPQTESEDEGCDRGPGRHHGRGHGLISQILPVGR